MKKLSVVIASAFVLVGCVAVDPTNVSYPVQTEENVQNTEQSEQDFQESETNSEIVESVQEDVQLSESESAPESVEQEDSPERAEYDENVIVDAPNVEESARTHENLWISRCRNYNYNSTKEWADAYKSIINDVCSTTKVDNDVINVVYGPNASPKDPLTVAYIDTAIFSWSFWSNYVPRGEAKTTFIVVSPEDNDWWQKNSTKYTSVPQDALGSCRYFDENKFCSYKYVTSEGKSNLDGDVFLWVVEQGSPLKSDTYIDPAHNAVHWFQDAYGYRHWHEFFIEGHATMYEIAFHIIDRSRDNYREGYAWLAHTMDNFKFNATTVEETNFHFDRCYGRGGDCNHFYYGGGAMFHETLILNYGYDSYLDWTSSLSRVDTISEFNNLFSSQFSTSISNYQSDQFANYVTRSFSYYYNLW